ncbi:hypothetical protein [Xenophilus sp.]|uniref:hypothetical protein n=1 Tax=Xenophilus sp. TaxID=1873499 RepID=UPI0037DCF098
MTTTTDTSLHAIAIDVVGQYNAAGKHLLGAYRAGARRLLDGAAARTPATPAFVGEKIGQQVAEAQAKFNGFLADRLDKDTALAAQVMDIVADRTTGGIQAVADAAQRVTVEPGVSLLNTLRALHLPLAQISLKVADSIATGAEQLAARVAATAESADGATTVRVKSQRARAAAEKA